MSDILCGIFYGQNTPHENIAPQNNSKYIAVNSRIQQEKNHFQTILSAEDFKRLEGLEVMYTESSAIETETAFKEGFCFGAKLIIEVYCQK